MRLVLFFVVVAGLIFTGCRREDPPYLYISPSSSQIYSDAGDITEFTIEGFAGSNELRNILIQVKPNGGVTSTVKDTSIYGKEAKFFWVFTAPSGVSDVIVTFTIYDTEGNNNSVVKRVNVDSASPLTENSGFEIYSKYSTGLVNAMNIRTYAQYQLQANPDSTLVDLVEFDETEDGELNYALTSYSGVKFVRNNSFNYPEATMGSAKDSYTSSTALNIINNVALNDILITEYDTINHLFAVIKVTGLSNEVGSNSDKYTFNIKK
ncbi:MAG: hypothetical protein R2809_03675 [Flavobacteriales bacterium]